MRTLSSAVLILVAAFWMASSAGAAMPTAASCEAAKFKAAAKHANARLKCFAKANDTGNDPAECLAKAAAKLDAAVAKANERGSCASGDAGGALADALNCTIDAASDALEASLVKCQGKKIRASAKALGTLLQCRAKAAAKEQKLDEGCVEKAVTKLEAAFAKAEAGGECATTDDVETIQELLEESVDRLLAELEGEISETASFSFTGGEQTFVVPVCASTLLIEACGAQGESGGGPEGGAGGLGGCASGTYAATSGETLHIFVGGTGDPFNGGGAGGNDSGGDGGGASDVRVGGIDIANRILVGGGGGGGGGTGCDPDLPGGAGGGGGGLAGGDGTSSESGIAGSGGTSGVGGLPGAGCPGFPGTAGTSEGIGGDAQACCCFGTPRLPGGGGGGGGVVVGGGGGGGSAGTPVCSGNDKGGGGGGAGGTSSVSGVAGGVTLDNVQAGNGQVTINW
jgi:hypothetical protein